MSGGTLFGLGMSQRVDSNGKPAVGWLLYVYAANSSTPSNTYQDTGLTVLNPWPIAADGNGTMPPFWLADGSYRARATSADGSITYFDQLDILAIGASSGSSPGGGVDQTTIFNTGDVMWQDIQGTRTGWVRDNGRTIGSATSGATERANSDCQALFEFLWNNYSNTINAVSSGRGVSALADWNANKTIQLADKRGYIVGGLDDMGNSAAGNLSGVPVKSGSVTTAGSQVGEQSHVLTTGEAPSGLISGINQNSHTHTVNSNSNVADDGGSVIGGVNAGSGLYAVGRSVTTSGVAPTINWTDNGGNNGHNTVQYMILGTFYRKL